MQHKIYTVGNMVGIPIEVQCNQHTNDNSIVFVGKMSYEPNIVAVDYFAKKIFPFLKEKYADLTFTIVGASPTAKVITLQDIEGVVVTGFVDSVEKYLTNASIVIAPMLTGAGIQNKIIQAMSYSCCVATSLIGAEGLHINDNEICIFNDDNEWVEGILNLLSSPYLRRDMGKKARQYVIDNLSKEVIARQFHDFIGDIHNFRAENESEITG